MSTKIEWTDETWNPVMGCSPVSDGCKNCYAISQMRRFAGMKGWPKDPNVVTLFPDRLMRPSMWRSRKRVFVCSVSDLFHEDVPFSFIDQIYAAMALSPQHVFQILTKRPLRMAKYLSAGYVEFCDRLNEASRTLHRAKPGEDFPVIMPTQKHGMVPGVAWPLSNVWHGVTVENVATLNRIKLLRKCRPTRRRFVSFEPLIGSALKGTAIGEVLQGIDWVIIGGESGPNARPMHMDWVAEIIEEARECHSHIFVKQLGSWWAKEHKSKSRKGNIMDEWRTQFMVRESPDFFLDKT